MRNLVRVALATVLTMASSNIAFAQDQFVLTAPSWGEAQNRAVAAAGGTVTFSHDGAGVAVVQSSAPDFLARVPGA